MTTNYYTVYLYERDEQGKFWPAGQYSYPDMLKRATRHLESAVTPEMLDICGMIRTPNTIYSFRNMTAEEAIRLSPVKILRGM